MFDFKSVSHVPTFKPSAAKLEDSRIFQRAMRLCDESSNVAVAAAVTTITTTSDDQDQISRLRQHLAAETGNGGADIEVESS